MAFIRLFIYLAICVDMMNAFSLIGSTDFTTTKSTPSTSGRRKTHSTQSTIGKNPQPAWTRVSPMALMQAVENKPTPVLNGRVFWTRSLNNFAIKTSVVLDMSDGSTLEAITSKKPTVNDKKPKSTLATGNKKIAIKVYKEKNRLIKVLLLGFTATALILFAVFSGIKCVLHARKQKSGKGVYTINAKPLPWNFTREKEKGLELANYAV